MQDSKRRSPMQLFSDSEVDINIKHFKPFGSPTYVLASELQANQPYPKWKSRATVGVYLGQSPVHNRNVALVLHRFTGYVSPQFHVKIDSGFHSCSQESLHSTWQEKTGFANPQPKRSLQIRPSRTERRRLKRRILDSEGAGVPAPQAAAAQTATANASDAAVSGANAQDANANASEAAVSGANANASEQTRRQGVATPVDKNRATVSTPEGGNNNELDLLVPSEGGNDGQTPSPSTGVTTQHATKPPERVATAQMEMSTNTRNSGDTEGSAEHGRPIAVDKPDDGTGTHSPAARAPSGVRHSARMYKPTQRLLEVMTAEITERTNGPRTDHPYACGEIFCLPSLFGNDEDAGDKNPLSVFKATTDPDTMYMHEAMKQPDSEEFKVAMVKEWEAQVENGNFSLVSRKDVPDRNPILPTVWQMKRKRDIRTREIKKHKARLNIDGSRMEYGVHYDQTYSPVASWNSIRLLLTLAAVHGWHTTQIDYVLAFPQAPVEKDLYMEISCVNSAKTVARATNSPIQLPTNPHKTGTKTPTCVGDWQTKIFGDGAQTPYSHPNQRWKEIQRQLTFFSDSGCSRHHAHATTPTATLLKATQIEWWTDPRRSDLDPVEKDFASG